MSPESMLLSAATAAPSAPQPVRSAPAAPSYSGADSTQGSGTDQPQPAPSPAPSAQNGQSTATPAPSRPAGRKDTGERHSAAAHKSAAERKPAAGHKSAASKAPHAQGHSSQPAARPAHPGGSFSQALAQSLATPDRGTVSVSNTAARGHGSPAGKPAAHAPSKQSKSDPVSSALALVSHAPSGAPPAGAADAGPGKAEAKVVPASLLDKPKQAAQAAQGAKALLVRTNAQDLKALGPAEGSTAAPPTAPAANAAAVLAGAQAGVATVTAASTHAAALAHAEANPASTLSAPVGTTAWTDQLGARLTWMTHQGIGSASLQLSPEHLGPLQVSISVHHGQASVWFGAAHAETRQALEQAMPQLRQMLSGQGLTLTDSGVSRDSPRGQTPRKATVGQIGAVAEESGGTSGPVSAHLGLVDAYA